MKSKLICIMALLFILTSCSTGRNTMTVKAAYMTDQGEESIQLITRTIKRTEGEELYRAIIEELIKSPEDERYTSVFPASTTVEDVKYYEAYGNYSGVIVAVLGGGYKYLEGIDKTIADYCIVMSMCELDGVSGVVVYSEEIPSVLASNVLDPEDIIMNASALRTAQYNLNLWYPSNTRLGALDQMEKTVVATVDTDEAEVIFRALLDISTSSENIKFIDSATSVISSNIEKNICYLNLTDDFLRYFHYSPMGENLTIRAVANSICEMEEIEAVQFLINGNVYIGEDGILSKPIEARY